MFNVDLYTAERTMHMRVEEALRQARAEQQGWLSRQGRRLLCQLGHLLVALGERLKRCSLPQSLPLQGQMSGGRCSRSFP